MKVIAYFMPHKWHRLPYYATKYVEKETFML